MCGRYTLNQTNPTVLRRRFGLDPEADVGDQRRFNIAPTDPVLAIRRASDGTRNAGTLRWGLLPGYWATKSGQRPLINARAETIAQTSAYAESFRERRCLIPADGFYEWRTGEAGKVPVWLSRPDGEPFAFAGVWAELELRSRDGEGDGGEVVHSCAIVTCAPNALIRPIHDRMPVILAPELEAGWLDPERTEAELVELLRPAPEGALVARDVSDAVNDVRNDGPELIEPRVEDPRLF